MKQGGQEPAVQIDIWVSTPQMWPSLTNATKLEVYMEVFTLIKTWGFI